MSDPISSEAEKAYQRNMRRCMFIGKFIGVNPYDVMSAAIRRAQALGILTGSVLQRWEDQVNAGESVNLDD